MAEIIPTTEGVRSQYASDVFHQRASRYAEFDRWLAEHNRQVATGWLPDEPIHNEDSRWAYLELTKAQAYAAWPCATCGVRRDEHADQATPSAFPALDITEHAFVFAATLVEHVIDRPEAPALIVREVTVSERGTHVLIEREGIPLIRGWLHPEPPAPAGVTVTQEAVEAARRGVYLALARNEGSDEVMHVALAALGLTITDTPTDVLCSSCHQPMDTPGCCTSPESKAKYPQGFHTISDGLPKRAADTPTEGGAR